MLAAGLYSLGSVIVLYCLVSTLAVGMIPFTNLLCVGGITLLILGFLEQKYGTFPIARRLKKILLPVAAVGLVGFGILEMLIIGSAAHKDSEPADYLLILGAGLRGEEMSLTLLSRMQTAVSCEDGEKFVVSGGQGKNESIPEAQAMQNYLLGQGYSVERILTETQSTSTMENLIYSREIIEKDSGRPIQEVKIKIVTSDYHTFRAKMLAKRAGYGEVSSYGASTPFWTIPSSYIREAAALVKSFLMDH
ncbi:MAG: YdcF family protein [Candidatus Merdivicinus sp.]|jgi:uncharacterized SAM-binding protein YcdF (DUF218 family)